MFYLVLFFKSVNKKKEGLLFFTWPLSEGQANKSYLYNVDVLLYKNSNIKKNISVNFTPHQTSKWPFLNILKAGIF